MKYDVEVIIKEVVNLTVDADNEEMAAEVADKKFSYVYDCDTYYEIGTITLMGSD